MNTHARYYEKRNFFDIDVLYDCVTLVESSVLRSEPEPVRHISANLEPTPNLKGSVSSLIRSFSVQ